MSDLMLGATVTQATTGEALIPLTVIEALLQGYLGDTTATVTACTIRPFSHLGTNDSSTLYRATVAWQSATPTPTPQLVTWIVKHWQAGGLRDRSLGIFQSREALAWEAGWLQPDALPPGVVVPIAGVLRSPDNRQAWVAMQDVSVELSAYQRMTLTVEQTISQTETVLARLARFHALWEEPQRQDALQAATWLRRPETFLWEMAPSYAAMLGRPIGAEVILQADVEAFLAAQAQPERRLWEELMVDRRALIAGLAELPQTLLHTDLDDRNIGLRRLGSDAPELVLIDWEWMARGAAAIDVANLMLKVPILLAPGEPFPETDRIHQLVADYFSHYRAAGGRGVDAASWQRSYALAFIARGVAQMPFMLGSLRRSISGDKPLPAIIGAPQSVVRRKLKMTLPALEWMEQEWVEQVRRYWL